jgi:hypothetical protein
VKIVNNAVLEKDNECNVCSAKLSCKEWTGFAAPKGCPLADVAVFENNVDEDRWYSTVCDIHNNFDSKDIEKIIIVKKAKE